MLFFLKHDGKEYKVRVESRRNRIYLSYDGAEEERVDITFDGNDCLFIRNGKVFYGNTLGKKNDYTVWLPEGSLNVTVESEYKRIITKLKGQVLEDDSTVVAKMPGKIVKILVEHGEHVEQGQSVIIMEAMKMENEIRSNSTGKIRKIRVTEGQAVESGATLLELETLES